MQDFRCQCKKIVCQVEGNTVIIKCRHCKRYIHIHTKGLLNIEFKLESGPGEQTVILPADLKKE
ncbi:MAG: hypothetical protein ACYC2T_06875 [Bacillota bacterium]